MHWMRMCKAFEFVLKKLSFIVKNILMEVDSRKYPKSYFSKFATYSNKLSLE